MIPKIRGIGPMDVIPKDRRRQDRDFVEPYTTNTYLEFTLSGRRHRCLLLDVSPGGVGMLVLHPEKEVLQHLRPSTRMSMAYTSPEATVTMSFEIRHITQIKRGDFKGHFQVGLCLVPEIE
jgi:hypothetical protein